MFLDIDNRSLEKSQSSVQRLVDFLYDNWGLSDYAVNSFFSGSKGFHVLLDTRIFADKMKPSKNLYLIHSAIRRRIPRLAGIDESLIDQSVCAKTQFISVNNTRNSKSGLYKIYLELHEFFNLSIEEIKDMAKTPQPGRYTDDSGLVPVNNHCIEPVDQAVKLYE